MPPVSFLNNQACLTASCASQLPPHAPAARAAATGAAHLRNSMMSPPRQRMSCAVWTVQRHVSKARWLWKPSKTAPNVKLIPKNVEKTNTGYISIGGILMKAVACAKLIADE